MRERAPRCDACTEGKSNLNSNELARRILELIEDKQATDIVLLDIREQSTIADYFIIATVHNERQAQAIEDDVREKLKLEQSIRPLSIEGAGGTGSGWLLLDYGDVIAHLFTPEARDYYRLEELWNKANIVIKVL